SLMRGLASVPASEEEARALRSSSCRPGTPKGLPRASAIRYPFCATGGRSSRQACRPSVGGEGQSALVEGDASGQALCPLDIRPLFGRDRGGLPGLGEQLAVSLRVRPRHLEDTSALLVDLPLRQDN